MAEVELGDLWKEEKQQFSNEEKDRIWLLLKIKLKRTLMTFHVLGRILYGAPARHSKEVSDEYTAAISRLDKAFQDFISCRKVYIHATPKPTRREVNVIQSTLSKHYERHIGQLGAEESHRKRIQDHEATIRLLRDTLKESFRYMQEKGFRTVDYFRSIALAADDGLICLREVYWKTKSFIVGDDVPHDWLVDELVTLGLEECLSTVLEEMQLVDPNGKFTFASLPDFLKD